MPRTKAKIIIRNPNALFNADVCACLMLMFFFKKREKKSNRIRTPLYLKAQPKILKGKGDLVHLDIDLTLLRLRGDTQGRVDSRNTTPSNQLLNLRNQLRDTERFRNEIILYLISLHHTHTNHPHKRGKGK